MGAAKSVLDEYEDRFATITAIAIEVKTLYVNESTHELSPVDDTNAERLLYARAFQAWVERKIEGTAEDVFDTIQEVLEL